MPRIIIILFSLFFTVIGNSQLSISAGFAKRVEGGWNKEGYRKFDHFDYKDRFWNDYFLLTADYQKNQFYSLLNCRFLRKAFRSMLIVAKSIFGIMVKPPFQTTPIARQKLTIRMLGLI